MVPDKYGTGCVTLETTDTSLAGLFFRGDPTPGRTRSLYGLWKNSRLSMPSIDDSPSAHREVASDPLTIHRPLSHHA